jgi:hypothetical protein
MMIRQQMKAAAEGNLAALQFLCERSEGKPRAVISGDEQNPLAFSVIHERGEEARQHIANELKRISERAVIEAEVIGGLDGVDAKHKG